jgi:subtilisin family serine protease
MSRIGRLAALAPIAVLCVAAGSAAAGPSPTSGEVVVELSAPALAHAPGTEARIASQQRLFARALTAAIPGARVGWRYTHVLNGVSVVLPRTVPSARLCTLPGVRRVFRPTVYTSSARSDATLPSPVAVSGATRSPALASAGDGMKIGIIDDGVDHTHRYFSPRGFTMPAGFPKGQSAYTSAKVIVARSFAPTGTTRAAALLPFERGASDHGTHVAGIAAGDAGTVPAPGRRALSGVAPRAYIGNYRVLTVPTDADVGLDGNAPEIVAAIEAAVQDGMDVINLSIGEPEIEPDNDVVARALDAAAAAGVVPVVAAGNDRLEFGTGSISSPGSSASAITVAAVSPASAGNPHVVAEFSSVGPTPLSLRMKPDVSAPGTSILSSVPGGRFEELSGTSMAAPYVAGTAALLLQRHPDWTVADVKSALVTTATTAFTTAGAEALPARAGGGVVSLADATEPLLLASPASVSFGMLRVGATAVQSIDLTDAGGGAGAWDVRIDTRAAPNGARVTADQSVLVPGRLTLSAGSGATTSPGVVTGFVVLARGAERRRVPFWLFVERPALEAAPAADLTGPGRFGSTTKGRTNLVATYRYPVLPSGLTPGGPLKGPERVYRVLIGENVANFGVVVLSRAPGVTVEPRIVRNADENRLVGYPGLPIALNPYLATFGSPVLAAGAISPLAGAYSVVFDSPALSGAGTFTFRYWVDDVQPPSVSLLSRRLLKPDRIRLRVSDSGAGIDPASATVRIDGVRVDDVEVQDGILSVGTTQLSRGRHRLRAQISDFQESRNMENVGRILPNTRVLDTTVVVR